METISKNFLLYRGNKAISIAVATVSGKLQKLSIYLKHLNEQEKFRFQEMRYDRRKTSYLLGRLSAKSALSSLTGISDVSQIFIDTGVFDFPVVRSSKIETQNLQVSISHCDMIGTSIAFEETHPMGIDLEKIQPQNEDVMQSQLTENEQILLKDLHLNNAIGYAIIWSVKESLSKVIKTGMMLDFSLLEVANTTVENNGYISVFSHFGQYKAVSYCFGSYVVSITLPKKSKADFHQIWALFDLLKLN